jgi:hypothetical protein
MAGLYIRMLTLPSGKITELLGTFFAGGSASIWIFSLSASLSVRLGQVNSNMLGEATFTFSFSLGLKDFDYSVSVQKQEKKGFSGGQSNAISGLRRFAPLGSSATARDACKLRPETGNATIKATVAPPHTNGSNTPDISTRR